MSSPLNNNLGVFAMGFILLLYIDLVIKVCIVAACFEVAWQCIGSVGHWQLKVMNWYHPWQLCLGLSVFIFIDGTSDISNHWLYHYTCLYIRLRSVGWVLIGNFRTLYNHVILDHRRCLLFIFLTDVYGHMISRYSENNHLSTLYQCKFCNFHFPPLKSISTDKRDIFLQ